MRSREQCEALWWTSNEITETRHESHFAFTYDCHTIGTHTTHFARASFLLRRLLHKCSVVEETLFFLLRLYVHIKRYFQATCISMWLCQVLKSGLFLNIGRRSIGLETVCKRPQWAFVVSMNWKNFKAEKRCGALFLKSAPAFVPDEIQ